MKALFVTLAGAAAVAVLLWLLSPAPVVSSHVVLRPAPGDTAVQMFERAVIGDEGKITTFPAGTNCTRLGENKVVRLDGNQWTFAHLACNGVSGYVNASYVR